MKRPITIIMSAVMVTATVAPSVGNIVYADEIVKQNIAEKGEGEVIAELKGNNVEITGSGTLNKIKFGNFISNLPKTGWETQEHSVIIKDGIALPIDSSDLFVSFDENNFLNKANLDLSEGVDYSTAKNLEKIYILKEGRSITANKAFFKEHPEALTIEDGKYAIYNTENKIFLDTVSYKDDLLKKINYLEDGRYTLKKALIDNESIERIILDQNEDISYLDIKDYIYDLAEGDTVVLKNEISTKNIGDFKAEIEITRADGGIVVVDIPYIVKEPIKFEVFPMVFSLGEDTSKVNLHINDFSKLDSFEILTPISTEKVGEFTTKVKFKFKNKTSKTLKIPYTVVDLSSSDISEAGDGSVMAEFMEEEGKVLITGTGTLDNLKFNRFISAISQERIPREKHTLEIRDALKLPENSSNLFRGAMYETFLNYASFDFNKNIDTSNVTDMSNMFARLDLAKIDISNWDLSKVTKFDGFFSLESENALTAKREFFINHPEAFTYTGEEFAIYDPEENMYPIEKLGELTGEIYTIKRVFVNLDKDISEAGDGSVMAHFIDEENKVEITGTGTLDKAKFKEFLGELPKDRWGYKGLFFDIKDPISLPADSSDMFVEKNLFGSAKIVFNKDVDISKVTKRDNFFILTPDNSITIRKDFFVGHPEALDTREYISYAAYDAENRIYLNTVDKSRDSFVEELGKLEGPEYTIRRALLSGIQSPLIAKGRDVNLAEYIYLCDGEKVRIVIPSTPISTENEGDFKTTLKIITRSGKVVVTDFSYSVVDISASDISEAGDGSVIAELIEDENKLLITGTGTISRNKLFEFVKRIPENYWWDKQHSLEVRDALVLPEDSKNLFAGAMYETFLNRASMDFNKNIDTSKVTNITRMFEYVYSANLNIVNWDLSKVTDYEEFFTIEDANSLTATKDFFISKPKALMLFKGEYVVYDSSGKKLPETVSDTREKLIAAIGKLPDGIYTVEANIDWKEVKKSNLKKGEKVTEQTYLDVAGEEGDKLESILTYIDTSKTGEGVAKVRLEKSDGKTIYVKIPYKVIEKTGGGGSHSGGGGGGSSSSSSSSVDLLSKVEFVVGKDRYETSLMSSKEVKSDVLVIASGENFADSLSAQNIVNKFNSKFILVNNNSDVNRILELTKPKKVYIMGGEASISKDIFKKFRAKVNETYRVSGADRYQTNLATLKVAEYDKFAVADGRGFADAFASAPLNKKKNLGLLLVNNTHPVKDKTVVYTYGGVNSVAQTLGKRIAGADRYETNAKINAELGKTEYSVITDGRKFPDALSAQNYVTSKNSEIILMKPNQKVDEKKIKDKKKNFILGGSLGLTLKNIFK